MEHLKGIRVLDLTAAVAGTSASPWRTFAQNLPTLPFTVNVSVDPTECKAQVAACLDESH